MERKRIPVLIVLITILVSLLGVQTCFAAREANIAFAANVSCSPAPADGSARYLTDGRIDTSLSFEVGTSGEASVEFSFSEPRTVSAVRLYQGSDVYFSTEYSIEADCDGDGEFETPLALAKNAPTQKWVEHSFKPLKVVAIRFRSTRGVSNGRRAHPSLAEFEVIGVPTPGDVEKASEQGVFLAELPCVIPLQRATALVANGRPPAILAPRLPTFAQATSALLEGLASFGVEQVRTVEQAAPQDRTVICLGNMLTNPLIERLYWNRYTFADATTPGPGKYLLHTVYDPYPFNGGKNVVVIGCSDAQGAKLGVQAFLAAIKDRALPYLVQVGPNGEISAEQAAKIAAEKPDPTFTELTNNANLYLQTGCDAYAKKAIAALEILASLYGPDGERVTLPAGDRRRLPWPEETTSWEILCAWDAFDECALITDDQRLRFTNAVLRFTRDLQTHCSGYSALGKGDLVSWNHTTFPLLGMHFGARYFHRYYGLADMPERLEKARAVFLAQGKSWKPQEDADSYLPLTTAHSYTYALAEQELGYFRHGNMRKYADYTVAICDNQGWPAGFGDSSFSSRPSNPTAVLPTALWATRDPGYKWLLDRFTGGSWDNPFDRGIKPVRPDRFCGINVFMMDPQLYEFTQTRPYYNEKLVAADVPAEQAWDKISFRESWDKDAQYLLLDGFARGKHLHYDGNSITEFVEGNERWLIDHDYLTRNTTEHSMLSVLRDGRCDELIPSMSGLSRSDDLPHAGYTDTYVNRYNGCDWRRQIIWSKGGYFLVADTAIAREPGSYDLELTWKTMDTAGQQHVVDGTDLVAERGTQASATIACTGIEDPEASGGRAVILGNATSQLAFGADLPEGEYALSIEGYGMDGSSDSLWVTVDGGDKQAFHMPQLKYARSSSTPVTMGDSPTPTVKLQGTEKHLLNVTLRENPPIRIDRFVLTDAAGNSTTYEAESAPASPDRSAELARRLHIKSADALTAWVANHERLGITVPVSVFHQRKSGDLSVGKAVRFANVVYTSLPNKRRDLQPFRLGENLVGLRGSSPALAILGPSETGGLTTDAQAGLVSAEAVSLVDMTSFRLGEVSIESTERISVDVELGTRRVTIRTEKPCTLTVSVGAGKATVRAGSRWASKMVPLSSIGESVAEALGGLLRQAGPDEATGAQSANGHEDPQWTAFDDDGLPVEHMKLADLADGLGERVFVCRGSALHCLDGAGKQLWAYHTAGSASDVAFADIRKSPGKEVLLGSSDSHVYVLSASGELIEKHEMRGIPWARSFGERPFGVCNVGAWDVNGDGATEIAVTMRNYDLQLLTSDWKLLWKHDYALHGSLQMSFEDIDGDDKPDTIFVGNRYGSSIGVDPAGKLVYQQYTSIGDVAYALGDINGDGKPEVVTGSSTGDAVATTLAPPSTVLWRFDNFGFPVNKALAADLDGDAKQEVILASGTGYLYALQEDGSVRWRHHAGVGVSDALVIPTENGPVICCGDRTGLVYVLNGRGEVLRQWSIAGAVKKLAHLPRGGSDALMVATTDGLVRCYPLD